METFKFIADVHSKDKERKNTDPFTSEYTEEESIAKKIKSGTA